MKRSILSILSLLVLPSNILAKPLQDSQFQLNNEIKNDNKKFSWYLQGRTQSSGTPNQIGIGAFQAFQINKNSLSFFDIQLNSEFGDFDGSESSYRIDKLFDGSSILNTEVASFGLNTSSKIGKRWISNKRSLIYGINFGYETRLMKTGDADNALVYNKNNAFFSQLSVGLEASKKRWNINSYGLIPINDEDKKLNDTYIGSPITTYGIDLGFNINDSWDTTIGLYYQELDLYLKEELGLKTRISYKKPKNYNFGLKVTYDETFDTRISADITYFKNAGIRGKDINNKLLKSPTNRNIRIHDCGVEDLRNSRKWMQCKK